MLEILIFVVILVVSVLIINAVVQALSPNQDLTLIIKYAVCGVALVIALKKFWPLIGHLI